MGDVRQAPSINQIRKYAADRLKSLTLALNDKRRASRELGNFQALITSLPFASRGRCRATRIVLVGSIDRFQAPLKLSKRGVRNAPSSPRHRIAYRG
jgi:hypothetical protein